MEALVGTFARRGQRLTLHCERSADGLLVLIAIESGRPRTFPFTNLGRLIAFQRDMEAFLLRTGWTLLDRSSKPLELSPILDGSQSVLRLTLDTPAETIA